MPTLDDLPSIQPILTVVGGDLLPIFDISDIDGRVKKLRLNQINGLSATDVDTSVATGETVNTRLSVITGSTPTVTLPAVAGEMREVFLVNAASGSAIIDTPGSEKIFTGTADADTLTIATAKTAHLLSDGTKWYHVSNDA
jgi:hypothetical protein